VSQPLPPRPAPPSGPRPAGAVVPPRPPGPPPPPPPGVRPVPPGYVPVGWNGVPPPARVDGMAIASLLCGAVGGFCGITPILGLVFGLVARSRIAKSDGQLTGRGLALAGVLVSSAMLALTVVVLGLSFLGRP